MGSPKLPITIVIPLILLFFTYDSKGASYDTSGSQIKPVDYEKVNLSVYYESLSNSSAVFIVKNLREIFNNDLIDIVNLQLVPWANSHVNQTNNAISCQNGPDECELNSLAACALNIWPIVDEHYSLINCFEFLAIERNIKMWQDDCLKQLGLPLESFMNCFNGGNGTEFGQKYIDETAKLDPPHSFVPWVVVNNQPIEKDYENFTDYVCKAYKGAAIPAVCNVH